MKFLLCRRLGRYILFRILIISLLFITGCSKQFVQIEIQTIQAKQILDFALSQNGKPYVWGGQDPNIGFDCSGLIVWASKQVFPNCKFLWDGKLVDDVDVEHLYKENCKIIDLTETVPGDLVFFANSDNIIDHVGFLISYSGDKVEIIHASGGLGKVVIEIWQIGEVIRGGHIEKFGRLKIIL